MKVLRKHLKEETYQKVYLFYGEEDYLVKLYEKQIREKLVGLGLEMMNSDTFEGKTIATHAIVDAAMTLPFMTEKRLVIVRESGLFIAGRKDDSEKMVDFMSDIPDTTVLVFCETAVDKRSRLFKKVSEIGYAVDFKTPSEAELCTWVIRLCKEAKKDISKQNALFFLDTVATDMNLIVREITKLIAYHESNHEITEEGIRVVCTKSLESRIFDLVDAVAERQIDSALEIYNGLIIMKESPIMIVSMIARQFRLILQCKDMSHMGTSDIATALSQRSFVVSKCLKQGRNFSREKLITAIRDCLETDTNIKTGKMGDKLAVEILLLKCTGNIMNPENWTEKR